MPAYAEKVPALNGVVFRYEGQTSWFYRELIAGTKRYRTKQIPDAANKEQAVANAYMALLELSGKPVKPVQQRQSIKQSTIADEVEAWISHSEKRVAAGLKDEKAHIRRCISLRNHLLAYLNKTGVKYPSQITETTFDDYVLFRRHVAKSTRQTELKEVGIFLRHWLVRHKMVSAEVGLSPTLIPKVALTSEDLDANPSISPHDYSLINKHIRNTWVPGAHNKNSKYFRQMFWCLVHLLKNTGCRPIELLALRYRDITITNPKRWSESQQAYVDDYKATLFIYKSKTGRARDVICRSNSPERLLEFRRFQRAYFEGYRIPLPSEDSLVFGKPGEMDKTYTHHYLNQVWRQEICGPLKSQFEGNRISKREYTLYSLRSTFIEGCIYDGVDIYTVATLCGNSVKTIQRYYDRHDVLKKAEQIQDIKRGRKKREPVEEIPFF